MNVKLCTKCNVKKLLNEENFYRARPTSSHPKGGWQSHCRSCWKMINRVNKARKLLAGSHK